MSAFLPGSDVQAHPRQQGRSLREWVDSLPEFFLSDQKITRDVSNAKKSGLLRKVGPRLYTPITTGDLAEVVRRNAIKIACLRFPGAVISHRTALEMRPTNGVVFMTGSYEATDTLPGLTIRLIQGTAPLDTDMPFLGAFRASNARAFLENLTPTRTTEVSRSLPIAEIELRLLKILDVDGEDRLNQLRDDARRIAPQLGATEAYKRLDITIGTLFRTRSGDLQNTTAKSRTAVHPCDNNSVRIFEHLATELLRWSDTSRPVNAMLKHERQYLAFVDAYFSNYIEGTQFVFEEAREIVFEDKVSHRPEDAHDILGTYAVLVDESEMRVSVKEFSRVEDLESTLQRRHHVILGGRPEKKPGVFKEIANRAGNTSFVAPNLVQGTLKEGLAIFHSLSTGFQRAVFMMFMIAEVHPFDDGNGRLARVMMNAELHSHDQAHIIIATAYREDYLGALRRLSRDEDAVTFVRMLDRAQEYTSRLSFEDLDVLVKTLSQTNAFDDSGRRILKLP